MVQGELSFSASSGDSSGESRDAVSDGAKGKVYSVTQLTRLIKFTLSEHLPNKITLEGEISNFKRHSSGHLYLTLKDENAQITSVMWRSDAQRVKFNLSDGLAVTARGHVEVYEPQGKYQFYIESLQPAGVGALELAFRQLADKLSREGLFDEKHKKPLPVFPRTIAIVTSDTGAAIQDIQNTLHRRFPIVRKLFYPVAVQGDGAAEAIAAAIADLNRRRDLLGGIDVMIVGRGGGSIEDLWAFNEEIVARAIYASAIPVISGVGHQIDTTIADLVADRRAATPTAAAELATPMLADLQQELSELRRLLQHHLRKQMEQSESELHRLSHRPLFVRPSERVRQFEQSLDERQESLQRRMIESIRRSERTLEAYAKTLRQIEPLSLLGRLRGELSDRHHRLGSVLREQMQQRRHGLDRFGVKLTSAGPAGLTPPRRIILKHLTSRLAQARRHRHRDSERRLEAVHHRLINIDPRAILRRGYSITRMGKTGGIVTEQSAVQIGDMLHTELANEITIASQVTQPAVRKEDSNG